MKQEMGQVLIQSDLSRTFNPNLTGFPEMKPISIRVKKNGQIQSPGFPDSPYPPNMYQKWQLRANQGHRVRLDFHTLNLEDDCQMDFIKIYDSLVPIEPQALTE